MKRLFFSVSSLVLGLATVLVSCSTIIPSYSKHNDPVSHKTEETNNDLGSVEVYNNFLESLDNVMTRDVVEEKYPDYYGGNYVNESGIVVFQIVIGKDLHAAKQDLVKRTKSSKFETQLVEYSYTELQEVQDRLKSKQADPNFASKKEELKWYGLYIDPIRNRVIVRLEEPTEEYIIKFKNEVLDSPLIEFEQGFKIILGESVELLPLSPRLTY